jgi:hypothetical protein
MKQRLLTLLAGVIMLFSSCSKDNIWGEGPVVTETRSVTRFGGVSAGIPGKVNVRIDPVFKVEVSAQQNILAVMRTRVINGILTIDFERNARVRSHDDITINITAPSIDYLRVSGTGDIDARGNMSSNTLDLGVSGSGSIIVENAVVADKLWAKISGSGNISMTAGSARNEELRISGSGNIDLGNVPAEKAETHISGSGDMKVQLSQRLDAHISGSGSVYYRGNPVITTHISGSGSVRPW